MVWTSKPSAEARGDGDGDQGASGSFEAGGTWRDRGLASMLSKAAVEACPLDEDKTKMPLRGCIFISSCRGSVVFYLPPMDFV